MAVSRAEAFGRDAGAPFPAADPCRNPAKTESGSALANEVAAAARPHAGGMRRMCGDITAVSAAIGPGLAVKQQGHFPGENDVRRLFVVLVIRIKDVGAVLPHIGAAKTFAAQAVGKLFLVHVLRIRRRIGGFIAGR